MIEPNAQPLTLHDMASRINWLRSQVHGIEAQLAARRSPRDTEWRARTTAAHGYRLDELRALKLRRAEELERKRGAVPLLSEAFNILLDVDDLDERELEVLEDVREYLQEVSNRSER